ncbi:MAG: hypothetical protein QXX36_00020 [Candidatus Rehaiarchaeum fermentans]|nr:hypothetical protein [Candidatus Rehaiarchaeum fermentans]MCW1292074.1 hypothetical protein [Candidatus Rehaiarchaeum fermentans]MCW1292863.1 hypothetical protein [Candidatus Rehaiarchaeum fermentans]MCW1293365.1 hypothetical protein [Candidatus Rehaiarchaeum fermentans]MCW1297558.1 hypothetical protein [Candidatus Rehaiarchaeum fermentans]
MKGMAEQTLLYILFAVLALFLIIIFIILFGPSNLSKSVSNSINSALISIFGPLLKFI